MSPSAAGAPGPPRPGAVEAAAEVLGSRAVFDLSLGARTTYRVGGTARLGFELSEPDDDLLVAEALASAPLLPVIAVGRGSNLLVPDEGFDGLALLVGSTGAWGGIDIDDDGVVRAGAGTLLPVLARRTAAAGRSGLEWAVGVPGSVGGAVRMNAGGHGSDISGSICEATVTDLSTGVRGVRPAFDLHHGYRSSALTSTDLVVAAGFATGPGDPAASAAAIEEIVRWRRENQPGGQNAGSVFVNPEGDSAGRLVDAAGCKGLRHGTAQVSPKHANFIQADPGGRAADVISLIREVRRRVLDHSGVDLHPEVKLAGASWEDPT